ncbi:TPA: tyrosine--tRNA ligase [Streptococcus equi subsp. zooepidemicus]|uniref:Tyrosine--tRNA ligase n=1 Tax=Streptococcus equi subsp. zooepidemicus (strain MGCS10565) TaxID=552526 RepID=SYY_STREM|nr:tyrosine--tRNA ligase [Streptococcus equi]B4U045.1 RecName: Full=Tyrosine--tRNA ligase; AltName: Full=Tyrosyl-tRNA synthetase; Short=TyrRS [Streptococcus equi subsp. zooepidemicus MGCS10565]ACG61488.1 tyrosyl-tRNA synthetase TyrS [Streptococcus equi subsp. zooepidemicus MGCS10565]MCD3386142.1 tyrosine--tRNA ligase [Streptococcus equi subsp. zooepidemicus]MCD3395374.1 tyrosine--tRNA ligase [Streptococcus equi subsp. zooepidemicus]MCD3417135.1 tyrosine--tRNA ligase [Streptococcus equi subsp. 
MNIFEELKARGLVFQTTDEEALVKALTEGQVSYYTGYDPTADSLHLGHLVAILTSRRLQLAGHKPYALVGGATGLIGDPSFKDAERILQTKETVLDWSQKIKEQLSCFLDFDNGENKAELVNNYDWFSQISFIDFLRDVGKHFTVNYMMSKDSVKKRIETGISYTEFAYQVMQGYDFYELNAKHNVTLQIGGSDQWGNMTAGTELLRKKADKTGHVMTVPLITDATGKKFGKSEGNAIWLDAKKTSPYEMYQFWLNVMDDDAVRFLKIFTFLSLDEIAAIEEQFNAARHERLAQKTLAREVVTLVHGEAAYQQALNITEQLFAGAIKNLSAAELKQGLSNVPNYQVQAEDSLNIVDMLVTAGISPSKRQAREDLQNGAIYLNGERLQDLDYSLSTADRIDNQLTVIRRGKKKYAVLTY